MKFIPRWAWVALAFIVVGLGGYASGHHAATLSEREKARQEFLQHNADSLRIAAAASKAAHDSAAAAEHRADTARVTYRAARARVAIVNDSTVRVDSGPTVSVPPLVVTTMRRADDVVATDSAAKVAAHAELVSVMHERDLWHARADTLQRELAEKVPPLCSRKCGIAIGAAATYAALNPQKVVQLVTWLVKLVR